MHNECQHQRIQLYIMSHKSSDNIGKGLDCHIERVEVKEIRCRLEEDDDNNSSIINVVEDCQDELIEEGSKLAANPQSEKLSEWEARRYGAMLSVKGIVCCGDGDGLFVGFGGDGGWVRFKWREEMMVVVVFCGWCGGGVLWWWQRAAIRVEVLKQVQETSLYKHVMDILSSEKSSCQIKQSVGVRDSLPHIASSACCQGAGFLTGKLGLADRFCCRESKL
ncbi:glutathione gamma-glutamylcysteinyltransferase 1-like [Olea europaea subsp. europaea]|uniref:Glutathione gamma-glutamylcysteinyltransferase 1-like n=1 Tax=Olea europaea subsp. europaea TaxID=158383 RepID=A0A8S0TV60_OLEEU|nr:glutathione gamma-glutamylcysteinyltransferase 1-like [Olea europaea subsp. europaea]